MSQDDNKEVISYRSSDDEAAVEPEETSNDIPLSIDVAESQPDGIESELEHAGGGKAVEGSGKVAKKAGVHHGEKEQDLAKNQDPALHTDSEPTSRLRENTTTPANDVQDPIPPPPVHTMPAFERTTGRYSQTRPGAVAVMPTNSSSVPLVPAAPGILFNNLVGGEEERFGSSDSVPPADPSDGLVEAQPVEHDTASLMEAQEVDPQDLDGLVEAQPVEHDTASLMEAQEVDPQDLERREIREQKRRKCLFGWVIVAICCIVLALSLGFTLGKKDTKKAPTLAPTLAPMSLKSQVLSLLPTYTQESIAKDDTSPQAKAYDWLVADPNLTTYSDERIIQRFALGALFFATNGDAWTRNTHWMSYEVHECEWHAQDATKVFGGFSAAGGRGYLYFSTVIAPFLNASFPCADPVVEQQYTYLWLIANGLKGQLPPEVYLLTSLRHIALSINSLTGSALSTEIGKLSSLGGLDLSFNRFSGTIPTEIGLLSRLIGWGGRKNKFSGTLPSQLGQLSDNLMFFDMHDNLLSGSIPPSWGSLEKVNAILLYENQLSGAIPTSFGQLSEMMWLYLGENELLGTIPSQMGLLENLESLRLDRNSLTGSVPREIGNLVLNGSLETFHIYTNNLTGTLPTDDLCLIDTVSNFNSQLIGCNCTCSYQQNDVQLCSPLPSQCERLL